MQHNDSLAKQLNSNGTHLAAAVTVQRSAHDLYAAWHGFRDLPRFIDQVERVEELSPTRTRWTIRGPANALYTWEADTIRDEPDEVIAWKTDPGADVAHAGSINFRELPFHRGTEVKVSIEFLPAGGRAGSAVAKLFPNNPKTILERGLHRFRQAMETGEIATNVGQPVGADRDEQQRLTDPEIRDIAATENRP
jgi:uncharacterized membrane protein